MHRENNETFRKYRRILLAAAAAALVITPAVVVFHGAEETRVSAVPAKPLVAALGTPPANARVVADDRVQLRPLPVSLTSASHEWTGGDGADIHLIERIAHNPDEALRMLEENERIHRRQLVYRKKTAAEVIGQARENGEPVRQLTLPALDGRELEFEVLHTDVDPSGHSGSLAGRLAGQPDSMVILSFRGGREAFSVSSPAENLHLQADPREPGEVIVKHIDPATYIQGGCGHPDHNH